jgi:hypothetical protein
LHPREDTSRNWALMEARPAGLPATRPATCQRVPLIHAAVADSAETLHDPFWRDSAACYDELEVARRAVPRWSCVSFVHAASGAASGKRYVDDFEYLWSKQSDRPKEFDDRILPHTLYILSPALRERAKRAMNGTTDLLTTIDGVLVLAPRLEELVAEHAGNCGAPAVKLFCPES